MSHIYFDTATCITCRACENICPNHAISLRIKDKNSSKNLFIIKRDHNLCKSCMLCIERCTVKNGSIVKKNHSSLNLPDSTEAQFLLCDKCEDKIASIAHLSWLIKRMSPKLSPLLKAAHIRIEKLPANSEILCENCQ